MPWVVLKIHFVSPANLYRLLFARTFGIKSQENSEETFTSALKSKVLFVYNIKTLWQEPDTKWCCLVRQNFQSNSVFFFFKCQFTVGWQNWQIIYLYKYYNGYHLSSTKPNGLLSGFLIKILKSNPIQLEKWSEKFQHICSSVSF